jgi:peptidoglycan/xylan/chitin deacetylase (PgdA/CDA1 family)
MWTALPAAQLRAQLTYLKRHYEVRALSDVVQCLRAGGRLPPYVAVVTFDDGYRDNFTRAFPILVELGVPATIFLATGFLDDGAPLWPDRLTLWLRHATVPALDYLGQSLSLSDARARSCARDVIAQHLKLLPRAQKEEQLAHLQRVLAVAPTVASDTEDFLPLTWEQVRIMQAGGLVEFGGHTVHHEIVSQLEAHDKRREIEESCRRVAEETGRPCRLFAYPNGRAVDFDEASKCILKACGVIGAVTTMEGLAHCGDDPFALSRVLVGSDASAAKFELLSAGVIAAWQQLVRRRPALRNAGAMNPLPL